MSGCCLCDSTYSLVELSFHSVLSVSSSQVAIPISEQLPTESQDPLGRWYCCRQQGPAIMVLNIFPCG